jgi:DNA primase catalytic core
VTRRDRLVQAHDAAAAFYRDNLLSPRGTGPRQYLAGRHLDEVLDDPRWTIGYAPPGWTQLLPHLNHGGFTNTEIRAAGLTVQTRTGSLVDRFRDRIMFGIRDPNGQLVGFVGRCPPRASRDTPKYLNSPRTDLFSKGQHLFGLAEQRGLLGAGAAPLLLEGPLDVLAIATVTDGFAGVSASGTALSLTQAGTLRVHSRHQTVVVAYDADAAGDRAAVTAYERLAPLFQSVLVARMPKGHDPASLAAADPACMTRSLRTAAPLADHLLDNVLKHYQPKLDNAEARVCALHESTRLIARLRPDDVARQVARVADRLDLSPSDVTRDLLDDVGRHKTPSTTSIRTVALHSQTRRPSTTQRLSL